MTAYRVVGYRPQVSRSEARAPDCAQFSLGISSKMTIVASGVGGAMFTIASVITLANSCFCARVRPVHIPTRTTGIASLRLRIRFWPQLSLAFGGCQPVDSKRANMPTPVDSHLGRRLLWGNAMRLAPNLAEERALWLQGLDLVAGGDEVGRGPLAGPEVRRVRLRPQQGLRHAGAPGGAAPAGPVRHSPPLLRARAGDGRRRPFGRLRARLIRLR